MSGRKVCFSYRGIKKQCSSCFGPHKRKFCKYEKMSKEEYANRFRVRNTYVPEQFYGRLAKFENIAEQERKGQKEASGQVGPTENKTVQIHTRKTQPVRTLVPTSEQLKVTLRRSDGDVWTANSASRSKPDTAPNPGGPASKPLNLPTTSVAENVSSFLSGIRASFRSENVNVALSGSRNVNVVNKSQPKNTNDKQL